MDAHYSAGYRELYEKHWWWRAREAIILRTLDQLRPEGEWGSILDVGCGEGLFFDRLAERGAVEGVEADASLAEATRWRDRIYVGNFDPSFQPGKRYSLILMLDVLEHLAEPGVSLRHALDLLEPHGTVLITVPAFRSLWTSHDVLNDHLTRYTKQSFARVAREAGMHVEESRYFFHWMFPAKLAVHLKEKIAPVSPTVPRVPARWINQPLYHLSVLEGKIFRALPVPFGGSLMVVGRKP